MKAPAPLSMAVVLLAIISGAFGAAAFREALFELERLLHGNAGHLVAVAQALSWWQRLLFPCLGGLRPESCCIWAHGGSGPETAPSTSKPSPSDTAASTRAVRLCAVRRR